MNNIKIKLKILMVVAILGVVVIASSIFSGISMRSIEGGYSGLIGHEEKAQIASARGGRDLYIVIASSYGLAFETTDEGNARMLKVTLDAEKTYLDRLETLKGLMPSYSQRIEEIATEARAGFSQCEAPIKQAAASTDAASILEAGKLLKQQCEAVLMPVFSKQRALTDAIEAEAGKTVGSLSDQTVTTIVTAEVAVGVGLILAVLLALWIAGPKIVTPLTRLVEVMKRLADNDLSVEIPECDRADEVGVMARTVEVFKENAIERRKMEEREKAEQAHREARAKAVESLTTNFDQSVANVLDTVSGASTELEATAASMASGAEQTTRQAATVASATEEASNAVQTVASAAEELSASIREIGRQVTEASNVASSASEDANRTNQTVFELAETASKIGAVVNLITDIASQTNLLALNATIEAARAGDAGKGFAVVANEVKHLANQTGKATEEISGQITAIQAQTQKVVEAIGFIVKRIEEISHISTAIASAVEEQSAATSEIAGNVQQAAQGTNLVSASIGGVSDAASMTGAASQQVLTSARSLSGEAEHLKSIVTTFLREVRAA